ncbi:MAG: hypothetical protein AAB071_00345 [Bacteroidota bacterium]
MKKTITLTFFMLLLDLQFVNSQTQFWSSTGGPFYGQVFTIEIDSSNNVWGGTDGGVYMSSNFGTTWRSTGLKNYSVYALAVHSNGSVFAGTDRGVFRSSDNGSHWTLLNGGFPMLVPIHTIAIRLNGDIFIGSREGKNARSTDNGDSWIDFHWPRVMDSAVICFYLEIPQFIAVPNMGQFN